VGFAGCHVPRPRDATGPNADAIEAANAIDLETERVPLLQKIARRTSLSQVEQIYLVNSIYYRGLGGPQAEALITLLNNPVCTQETRQHIADHLNMVTFSNQRRRVAEALIETAAPEEPAAPDAEARRADDAPPGG
jgi:hypothetical protein